MIWWIISKASDKPFDDNFYFYTKVKVIIKTYSTLPDPNKNKVKKQQHKLEILTYNAQLHNQLLNNAFHKNKTRTGYGSKK